MPDTAPQPNKKKTSRTLDGIRLATYLWTKIYFTMKGFTTTP